MSSRGPLPKLSIITVVYNGAEFLEQTIRSVLDQGYPELEYIVIDGGSTDGSAGIIERYASRLAYWVSEPDAGIYNAMNKGIAKATGDIVGIQNSDDWYEPGSFERVAQEHAARPRAVLYGLQRIHDNRGEREIRSYPHARLAERNITHSTVFVPKAVYDEFGVFDESYRITADYDLMLRLKQGGAEFSFVEAVISNFRRGGISSSRALLARIEAIRVLFRHGIIGAREFRRRSFVLKAKRLLGGR